MSISLEELITIIIMIIIFFIFLQINKIKIHYAIIISKQLVKK